MVVEVLRGKVGKERKKGMAEKSMGVLKVERGRG